MRPEEPLLNSLVGVVAVGAGALALMWTLGTLWQWAVEALLNA